MLARVVAGYKRRVSIKASKTSRDRDSSSRDLDSACKLLPVLIFNFVDKHDYAQLRASSLRQAVQKFTAPP